MHCVKVSIVAAFIQRRLNSTLNGGSEISRFKRRDAINIRNENNVRFLLRTAPCPNDTH